MTFGFCLLCALGVSDPGNDELVVVPFVDLTRYQGTWYEVARLPLWFQRGCTRSNATYTLVGGGKVAVRNECMTENGKHKEVTGYARVVDKKSNAKLEVMFDNWFSRLFPFLTKGKYWIIYLDTDYETAIVATPNRKYLWILARSPLMDKERYARLVAFCKDRGFNSERLIRDRYVGEKG
jgi:apolipoprotein D and lipocalin family protein